MRHSEPVFKEKGNGLVLGNDLTLDELSRIEEMAHRSHSREAETILRLSAALREAMQVRENAIALMSIFWRDGRAARIKSDFGKLPRD